MSRPMDHPAPVVQSWAEHQAEVRAETAAMEPDDLRALAALDAMFGRAS